MRRTKNLPLDNVYLSIILWKIGEIFDNISKMYENSLKHILKVKKRGNYRTIFVERTYRFWWFPMGVLNTKYLCRVIGKNWICMTRKYISIFLFNIPVTCFGYYNHVYLTLSLKNYFLPFVCICVFSLNKLHVEYVMVIKYIFKGVNTFYFIF